MMSMYRIALWLASLLMLAGCAGLPKDSKRAQLLDIAPVSQTLNNTSQTEKIIHDWPNTKWWQDFHSAELNRLIATALKDSPSLHAATARLSQAQAVADYQAAELLPTLNANADFHQRRFSGSDFYGPNGGKTFIGAYIDPAVFHYHLDLWGKDKAALQAALGKEQAQTAELAIVKLMLSTAIARSYIELSALEEDRELLAELYQKAQEKVQLVNLRWQTGLSNQDPIYVSQQQLEKLAQQQSSVQSQMQMLAHRLAALAGQPPDWSKSIHLDEIKVMAHLPKPERLSLGLLAHRPDIVAALWQVEAAAQLIKVAKTQFYPDINLVGFAGLRSLNLKDLFLSNGASVAYGMGPTISLPIFEGGHLEAELKNQQAAYDIAVESYNSTLLTAMQQVADSVVQWQQTLEHNTAQDRALTAAQAEFKLARQRYQAGLSSRDGVLEQESNWLQQQLTASKLHTDHLLADISLIEALGGGYENHAQHGTQP